MHEGYKRIKGFNKGYVSKVLIVKEQGKARSDLTNTDKIYFTNRVVDECKGLSVVL